MPVLQLIIGFAILIAVTVDVLVTTLTAGGGGPITSRMSAWLWLGLLEIHKRNSNHQMLATAGWMLLVGIAVLWYVASWLGWTCIFSAFENAVINGNTKEPAGMWERIYFTGFTLSTLGMGDYQPNGAFWQFSTAIASANGFFLVTLTFAYLLPLVSANAQKRANAVYISSLGGTGDEIISRAWNGEDFGQLDQHLITLTATLTELGENHLTYPVLHYFHSIDRSRAMALSLVALDEAMTLLQYGVKKESRPDAAALGAARRASSAFLKTLKSSYLEPASLDPPLPSLELLRVQGISTVSDREFLEATKQVIKRRRLLLALVKNDGWTWEAVASTRTTTRTSSLDDYTAIDDVTLK
ncbi:MAG: ion channel [Geitlerinemataceae cyanobacterium]